MLPLESVPLHRWKHMSETIDATLWFSVEASGMEEQLRGELDHPPKLLLAMALVNNTVKRGQLHILTCPNLRFNARVHGNPQSK